MIRIKAQLVLRVLDGFTGRPVDRSAILWRLDGQAYRPIAKDDGYYVMTDLDQGDHELILSGGSYQEERLIVSGGAGYRELLVTMKPGIRYPFGRAVTWLKLLGKPGQRIWIAAHDARVELRIAQDIIRAGENAGRLFFQEGVRTLGMPRYFMILDGERTEVCRLEELEEPCFADPLQFDHKRSCCLYPAQCHTADANGIIRAVFREPATVELLEDGHHDPLRLTLSEGVNEQILISE